MLNTIKYTILIALIFSNMAYADNKTIIATGQSSVPIQQTIAVVQLTISEDNASALNAQNNIRTKSAKLLQTLRAEKTLDMQTTAVTVNPIISYTDNKPKLSGYNASYTIQVKALIENMGTIIDHAVNVGANIVNEPQLIASDSDTAKAEKEAIKLATIDAKNRAETSLLALGFKPVAVSQITVQGINNQPQPLNMAVMKTFAAPATPPTQIIGGKTAITAVVSITMTY